jgi:16S rRNA (cytosine967-C5)-methyltransferase
VELAKDVCPRASALVNAVLRAVQRDRGAALAVVADDPVRVLVHAGSHPEWLVRRWLERFGAEEARRLCDYDNRRPALCLRVNRRRTTVAALVAAIPGSRPGSWAQDSVRCSESGYARVRALVQSGLASVQDESATLVVEEADPAAGETWIDVAASPGGKACHLAERVGDTGRVLAFDTTAPKVARVHANATRLGLAHLVAARGDARTLRLPPADGVLVDAPCTGLGVLARRPDARWRKRATDPGRLAVLQQELLKAAAHFVRPGGLLVYSVCSFEPEETLAVVTAFEATHPEFVPESGPAPPQLRERPGILYLLPQRHGTDGGFVARWRRTG